MIKLVEREKSGKRRGRLLVALRPIKILKKREYRPAGPLKWKDPTVFKKKETD